ncbi:MAG: hypothetical protein Q4G43_00685 [Mobilicoccus sp.]|nr:hypothetical protein [Mobilicoccus sp.]
MTTRPRTPDRLRVVTWIVGVAALGFVVLIVGASLALRATVIAGINESVAQEAGEIALFAQTAVDPSTGRPFPSADRFAEVYLSRQDPERTELLVGGSLGSSGPVSTRGADAPPWAALDAATTKEIMQPGSAGRLTTPRHGVVTWQNVQVQAGQTQGFVAVVSFHQHLEDQIRSRLFSLALLAALSLAATAAVAWTAVGRLVRSVHASASSAQPGRSSEVAPLEAPTPS